MSVAKVIEIISTSKVGFDDAIREGVARASDTVSEIAGAWVKDQSVDVTDGKVTAYKVTLKVTFVVKGTSRPKTKKK